MTVDEFESDVFAVAAASAICDIPVIRSLMPVSINIRIPMTIDGFIDIYYNESTGTTAYALIQNEQRVFGADNTGGWHVHPFNNPAGTIVNLSSVDVSGHPEARRATGIGQVGLE